MFLWKAIETLQHKNEEAARVSRELADEEVENRQEQLSSLEELQKKLVSTGGDKQALAQIQNELNDAIGETPGLLNDESNAYESATKKLWAKIEAEKAALKVSKMRQKEAARDQFNSNVGNTSYNPFDFSAEDMRAIAWDNSYSEESATHFYAKRQLGNNLVIGRKISKEEWANFWKEQVEYAKISWEDVVSEYSGTGGKSFAEGILETLVTSGYGDKDIDRLLPQLLDNDEFTKAIDEYLSSLSDPNKNSDSAKKNVEQIIESISNQFPKLNKFLDDYWYNLVSGSENAKDSIDNFIENYEAKLKSLNEELDKIQSAYQTVAAAIEEYNENGYLSVDTYQKLLELAPEYMSMLMDESGNLTLTKESWRLLTEAKIRDMYQTQANQYIESIKAAADSGNLEQLDKLTQGYKNLAEAKVIDYKATLATLNLTDEQRAGAEAYLSGLEKAMNQTIAGLGKGGMGGGSNTAKKQEDLAKQVREKEKQIEEAWEKERLEQLKDDLEKRKNEIEKYKNYIETLDFGLGIIETSDYSGKIDLLSQKYAKISDYTHQLNDELSRVLEMPYKTASEAQEIANRVKEIGSELTNNKKILKETIVEMQKARIEATRAATIDITNGLAEGLERTMWAFDQLENPYNRTNDFLDSMMSFDSLFGEVSELDKELEKKKQHDKALIAEEQATQDTIHQIVTDALELQAEENAKTRAEERAKLEEELAEISKEYKATLDTAATNTENTKNKITGSFNSVADSAGTMQQNVETHFGNMETSVTTHVDNTITKIDELKEKLADANSSTFNPNNSTPNAIAKSLVPDYKRISSPYGMRKHPITGETKMHNGIDIAADEGTDIKAAASGTVLLAGNNGGYGNCVIISHSDGTQTLYGHASKLLVSAGQKVEKGQVIAKVGSTGNSTGNHLHFETRINGKSYDPTFWASTHANGTKDFGIAGENYKKEYAINKKTGEWSVIDSPTLFDKDKFEIVGEDVSEKIDKPIDTFAKGTIVLPEGLGKYYTYEAWNRKEQGKTNWNKDSLQRKLVDVSTEKKDHWFNAEGYGLVANRYVVAVTDTFGSVGDYINIYNADGTIIPAVIGDIKNQSDAGANKWGHDNGASVVEFMTNWGKGHSNPKGNGGVLKIENIGNYFDNPELAANTKIVSDNTQALDENTKITEESVDTNPFSDANISKTVSEIEALGQLNKDKSDSYRRNRASEINYARINYELSDIEFYTQQKDLIETLLNGNDDILGFYDMEKEAIEKWGAAIQEARDSGATQEAIDALEQAMQDELTSFKELITNQTEILYEFDKKIAEKKVNDSKKWWNSIVAGFDNEQIYRDKRVDDLASLESLTEDPIAKAILRNRKYKENQDTVNYSKASQKANGEQRDAVMAQLFRFLDGNAITDINGVKLNPTDWFNIDGSISDEFERDMKDIISRYGEAVDTEIRGLVEGISIFGQAINNNIEAGKKAQNELYASDQERKQEFINAVQKAIDIETKAIEKQKENLNEQITYYNSLNTLLSKYYSVTNSITEAHHNINKELKAAQTSYKYLDAQTRLLLFNEKDYIALTKELNDIQVKANNLKSRYEYDLQHAQKEDIAEITNNYERQYDLLMKQYEISKAQLEVDKKRTQLNNILNERNVRMFVNGQWQWVANTQDVINAQNDLEDAKYSLSNAETQKYQTGETNKLSAKTDDLSTQINYLDSQITEINDRWNKITEIAEGGVLSVSQAWSDLVLTDSEYLDSFVSDITSAFSPLYEMLTGKNFVPLQEYKGYERSIEPESGYHKSGYAKIEEDESYSRSTINSDDYVVLTPDDVAKNLGITPLTQRDYSKLVASPPDIKGITKSYPLPETTNRTNNNVTNVDNSVTVNGVKLSEQDSKAVNEALRRHIAIH
ncbi:peptidoglycan DD-metalloendopeptidase family protein [Congzhengia minquanensis]|nr:peptidoglycan DD-metalloendopeptidase family protein [Congzhengia minquanensis]